MPILFDTPTSTGFFNTILKDPTILFEMLKGYIPPTVLQKIVKNQRGQDAFVLAWYKYLHNLSHKTSWRLVGVTDPDDFVSNMMMGYLPSKDAFQSQGGVWHAVQGYDPTRNGVRPTVCPRCGSSFWSHEHGNCSPEFADWGIPEYRNSPSDCPNSIRLDCSDGTERKMCGHIVSGPYGSKQAAQIACSSENEISEIKSQWFVVCGYQIGLMSFYNYVHSFVMKPLRAENRRYLTAKTKGRMNITSAYNCPVCNQLNEANCAENEESGNGSKDFYECKVCGARHESSTITFFVMERNNVSLDTPLGDDGKATIGDMLPSNGFADEELIQCEAQIQETLAAFTDILQSIADANLAEARKRFEDRQLSKLPQIERGLKRAKIKGDVEKIAKFQKQLDSEQENLIKDQNKIDYTINLVEMFKLHYIGDAEGNKVDLRKLTERFMFKSLPYTICEDCKYREYEQNETGKLERQQQDARIALKKRAEQGDVPGYDRQHILSTDIVDLYPNRGSFFYCKECGGHHLSYFGPGMKNPEEPRIEITPHIFQPAQREIRELESQIYSHKLVCAVCGTSNSVRPDRMTGKLLDHKISKKIVEQDGERVAVREKAEHVCSHCNNPLTLDDVITSSNAQNAYSLLVKLKNLVEDRNNLRAASKMQLAKEEGWDVSLSLRDK